MSDSGTFRTLVAAASAVGALVLAACSTPVGAPATVTVAADPVTVTRTVSSTVSVTAPASTVTASTVTAPPVTASTVTVTQTPAAAATSDRSTPTAAGASTSPAGGRADQPDLPAAQRAAVTSAQSYLEFSGFSRQGLIDQLSSEYGDKYSVEDATAAVDSLDVDWNAEAAQSAKSYTDLTGFSCQGLIDQLSSEYGDQYTPEQATFGATSVGLC